MTDVEQQQKNEEELQNQTTSKIEAIKQDIGEKLDKFGKELMAHLKSTGQTKPGYSDKEKETSKPGAAKN